MAIKLYIIYCNRLFFNKKEFLKFIEANESDTFIKGEYILQLIQK